MDAEGIAELVSTSSGCCLFRVSSSGGRVSLSLSLSLSGETVSLASPRRTLALRRSRESLGRFLWPMMDDEGTMAPCTLVGPHCFVSAIGARPPAQVSAFDKWSVLPLTKPARRNPRALTPGAARGTAFAGGPNLVGLGKACGDTAREAIDDAVLVLNDGRSVE